MKLCKSDIFDIGYISFRVKNNAKITVSGPVISVKNTSSKEMENWSKTQTVVIKNHGEEVVHLWYREGQCEVRANFEPGDSVKLEIPQGTKLAIWLEGGMDGLE